MEYSCEPDLIKCNKFVKFNTFSITDAAYFV